VLQSCFKEGQHKHTLFHLKKKKIRLKHRKHHHLEQKVSKLLQSCFKEDQHKHTLFHLKKKKIRLKHKKHHHLEQKVSMVLQSCFHLKNNINIEQHHQFEQDSGFLK
jgi:hypothetical protein